MKVDRFKPYSYVFDFLSVNFESCFLDLKRSKMDGFLIFKRPDKPMYGRLYTWMENSSRFFLYLKPVEISKKNLYNMRRELQSQNRVYINCEKTTGLIYLKFWHKILLMRTTEIQKMRTLAAKLTDLWLLIFQN